MLSSAILWVDLSFNGIEIKDSLYIYSIMIHTFEKDKHAKSSINRCYWLYWEEIIAHFGSKWILRNLWCEG